MVSVSNRLADLFADVQDSSPGVDHRVRKLIANHYIRGALDVVAG